MKVIGREKEQQWFESIYNSSEAEFVAVYGRRRIGKTYLIEQYFSAKPAIFFETIGINKAAMEQQLKEFIKDLSHTFYNDLPLAEVETWFEAFERLTAAINQQNKNKKIVLFFDELPWMVTPKSNFIQALEYYWNKHWSKNKKIKLIVCGSSASWIIKEIIKNKGGLHNRVTRKINLQAFKLKDAQAFLLSRKVKLSSMQLLKLYMATGGVAFYLKQIKKNLSVEQNINQLFFDSDGELFSEYEELFASLFLKAEAYKELVEIIASHQYGISRKQIEVKSKQTGAGGRLTERLRDLESAGFILSYLPNNNKKKGFVYRIQDEFCLFYLKWVAPIKNTLKHGAGTNYWKRYTNTPAYYGWQGYAFENICYKHLPEIKRTLKLDETTLVYPWRQLAKQVEFDQHGAQIDMLFDRADGALTIGEIKFSEKLFKIDKAYAQVLLNKQTVLSNNKGSKPQVFIAMISAMGVAKGIYKDELVDEVVTLEDLLK